VKTPRESAEERRAEEEEGTEAAAHGTRGGRRMGEKGRLAGGRAQRTTKGVILKTPVSGREVPRNATERQLRQLPGVARRGGAVDPHWQTERGTSPQIGRVKGAEDAQ